MKNDKKHLYYKEGMPESLNYPNVPVGAFLKGAARKYKDRIAYIYRDAEITFGELYDESLRFANALRKLGIGKGDVVAMHLPNCIQFISAYYGITMTGATYTPTNPAMPKDDLQYQLKDSTAKAVITHVAIAKVIEEIIDETELQLVVITGDSEIQSNDNPVDTSAYPSNWMSFAELKASATAEEFSVDIDPQNDLVHIGYTGGTTGKSKGVMITHANLISNVLQSAAWSSGSLAVVEEDGSVTVEPVEKDEDRFLSEYPTLPGTGIRLSPAPLFHAAGTLGGVVYPVALGTTTVLFDRFDVAKFLADIDEYNITEVSGAPAMFNFMLRHPDIKLRDFSSVRVVNSGAAPLVTEVMKLLQENFPHALVTEGYGLTEATASVINSVSFRSGLRKLGTVGLPIYDTEVKLISLGGNMNEEVPDGQPGEVIVKGPQIMKGYFNKPFETNETLVDGWLRTGDIAIRDEDGFITIVDRKKDMLIYNGFNVYPKKLEEILFEHPAVQNAVVIGKPNKDVGEIPKAFVILKPNASVSEEELMQFVNEKVIHYMKVRELEFIDELPMTAAGKILKNALRDQEIKKTQEVEK